MGPNTFFNIVVGGRYLHLETSVRDAVKTCVPRKCQRTPNSFAAINSTGNTCLQVCSMKLRLFSTSSYCNSGQKLSVSSMCVQSEE
jgi:hypothetical protein